MSGCGCSFTPVENKETEEIKYTDALAEQFAAEVGVDPRPNETLVEIDERGAFIRQPNAFIQPFGDKEGGLKAEANRFGIYWATGCNWSNRPIIVRELLGLQDVISETSFSIRRDKPLRTCIRTVSGFQGSGDRRLLLK